MLTDNDSAEHPPAERPAPAGREPRRSMEHSLRDGCAHAAMLGAGEAYLSPFAIFLGMRDLALGLLATMPLFLGSLAQLWAVRRLDRVRSRKPLVARAALFQAVSWLPILAAPILFPRSPATALLLIAGVYFALGGVALPPWNSWIGDLVPPRLRGAFFGRREQLRMAFQVAALIVAGSTLAVGRRLGSEWGGYVAIFALALAARLVSVRELRATWEPTYRPPTRAEAFTLVDFLRRSPWSNFGRFTVFVALYMCATGISGPYFAQFMLHDLEMSYLQFTACSAALLIAQVLTFRSWGRLGDRFGNRLLLRATSLAAPFVPLLWVVSCRFEALLAWQVVAGVVWAGFNLSTVNFLFDAVSPLKRARCVAYHNLLVNGGTLAGGAIGGWLLPHLPSTLVLPGATIRLVASVQTLFIVSGLARLLLAVGLAPVIREVRPVRRFGDVFVRIVGLAAARGVRVTVFNGVHEEERASAVDDESAAGPDPGR